MKSKSRKAHWVLVVAVLSIVGVVSVGFANDVMSLRVSTGGDPYEVTAKRLRRELASTGIDIRFFPRKTVKLVQSIVGVGSFGRAAIGFEFQLYPSSDQASVRNLGRLRWKQFGWKGSRPVSGVEVKLRGVLANVAYAQYIPFSEVDEPTRTFLRFDAQYRRVLRALDDALFASFPRDDPYAHALSTMP